MRPTIYPMAMLVLGTCLAPAHANLTTIQVFQDTSMILNFSSLGSDDSTYWPNNDPFSEFDMGPTMSMDERTNGNGFTRMAGYLNFGGTGAVEAQYSDIASGNQTSAFTEYFIRVQNDGNVAVPIFLKIGLQPGFARIDNGGGTEALPMRASVSATVQASNPQFPNSQPDLSPVWSFGLELVGPSSSSTTNINFNDPMGVGVPVNAQSIINGSVIEDIAGFNAFLDFGMLQPGQDIAFRCSASARVIGNTNGGHAMLGDAFGLIAGNSGAVGNACMPQMAIPIPAVAFLFPSGLLAGFAWMRRRKI